MENTVKICIFGASASRLDQKYFQAAEDLGRCIAEHGASLVFGGGTEGLMGACARGAKHRCGKLVGIAPRLFDEPGILFPECDELILTETMAERKDKMLAVSDAFIVLPGGIGTMDEFFEVITLKQLGTIHKPLVMLNTDGFYDNLLLFMKQMAKERFMSGRCLELLRVCRTPEEALSEAMRQEEMTGSIRRLEDYTER